MRIRAIIVDDETLAREGIKAFLDEESDVEVAEECADGASAVRAVERRRPDQDVGQRIWVKSADHILFVNAEEIDHVEAAGNYVILHAGKDRHIVRETMASMEARLGPAGFMRISRSAIVNLNRIARVEPLVAPGEFCLILKNDARLDMTCTLSELQQRMGAV